MTDTLTEASLHQFSGSEQWHRHGLIKHILFTDGAKHVADAGHAYWLLDEIALAQQFSRQVAAQPFQVWKLARTEGNAATLICEDGNGVPVIRKAIAFTDFPLPQITLWFTDNTILLPSEY